MSEDNRGLFITVEGSDGAGKSTQIDRIREFFENRGYDVICTREPGGTPIGEMLREILLDKDNSEMDPVTEMLMYAASRAQHVRERIIPAISAGKIVISDRFTDSSIAYQGGGRELGDMVEVVNGYATGGFKPDITFWLDLDPESARIRAINRQRINEDEELDRMEIEKMDFHRRVYDKYVELAKAEPERIVRIDASRDIADVAADIESHLKRFLDEQ